MTSTRPVEGMGQVTHKSDPIAALGSTRAAALEKFASVCSTLHARKEK